MNKDYIAIARVDKITYDGIEELAQIKNLKVSTIIRELLIQALYNQKITDMDNITRKETIRAHQNANIAKNCLAYINKITSEYLEQIK